jgi:hypothetical protein
VPDQLPDGPNAERGLIPSVRRDGADDLQEAVGGGAERRPR